MSWTGFKTILEVAVRLSFPTLPAGISGWETRQRAWEDLSADQLPHVFLYGYSERSRALDFGQYEVTRSFVLEFWSANPTEDSLQAIADTLRIAVHNNSTTTWQGAGGENVEIQSVVVAGAALGIHVAKAIGVAILDVDVVEAHL